MPANRSDFITRTPLDSLAFGLFLDDKQFVAKQLCNVIPFDKADKKIYQRDSSERDLVETKKATNAEADIVDRDLFSTAISTEEHKLKAPINPRDLRDAVFSHMQRLPLGYFHRTKAGQIISRITNDTDQTKSLITELVTRTVQNLAQIVTTLAALF